MARIIDLQHCSCEHPSRANQRPGDYDDAHLALSLYPVMLRALRAAGLHCQFMFGVASRTSCWLERLLLSEREPMPFESMRYRRTVRLL